MTNTNEPASVPTSTAACSCGAVTIALGAPPVFQAVCACRQCQSRTGSAFGMSAYFDRSDLLHEGGEPAVYRRLSDKGRALDFRFCRQCGTTVWWEAEFLAGKVGVAGRLLWGMEFRPDGAYFCATKPEWLSFAEAVPVARGSKMDT